MANSLQQRSWRSGYTSVVVWCSYCFAASLPFLLPYGVSRNIDLQGLVLILAGGFAWVALLLRNDWRGWKTLPGLLLAIFVASCVVTAFVTPHLSYNLLGTPYLRLGSLGLLSCVGFGLLLQKQRAESVARYIYAYSILIAIVSVLYAWLKFHGVSRFGGVFAQADIMACLLATGALLGWQFCNLRTRLGRLAICSQILLITLLGLTQTRAVVELFLLLSVVWVYREWRRYVWWAGLGMVILCMSAVLLSNTSHVKRFTDSGFAKDSVSYRLSLQHNALIATSKRPLAGYGPGNIADALDCRTLHGAALQHTCQSHFFFNSSHNIYLDRLLMLGWIGGASFAGLVVTVLLKGRRTKHSGLYMVGLLIALYYLTNVTSIEIELGLWIVLFQLYKPHSAN